MGIFRIFQPYTEEYMFMWNSLVALHTFEQLSEGKKKEVIEHYGRILALNNIDPFCDVAALAPLDPFWLSFTLGDIGVPPMLGPRRAKWFYVTNPRRARNWVPEEGEKLAARVLRDIYEKYGLMLKLPE